MDRLPPPGTMLTATGVVRRFDGYRVGTHDA